MRNALGGPRHTPNTTPAEKEKREAREGLIGISWKVLCLPQNTTQEEKHTFADPKCPFHQSCGRSWLLFVLHLNIVLKNLPSNYHGRRKDVSSFDAFTWKSLLFASSYSTFCSTQGGVTLLNCICCNFNAFVQTPPLAEKDKEFGL